MSLKFRLAFLVMVVVQVFVLLGLIGDREYTLRTGTEVVLEAVPVDPRSLLQGDYAILDYEVARLPSNTQIPIGQSIYVILVQRGEVWERSRHSTSKPTDRETVFIKGVVDRPRHLDFGIGTYFVPEGTGRIVERDREVRVVVSVDQRGKAVIKDVLVDGVPFNEAREARDQQ